jgi:ribosomal protein S18 acetylase RimI-like enzyme
MGVRAAKPCDLAAVLAVAREGFTGPELFGPRWLCDTLANPGTAMLVESPGANVVRGFLLTERYLTGTVVRYIAVGACYRKQGVGRRLLARVNGPASAWVRAENIASRSLFTASGWRSEIAPRQRRGEWCYFVRG